MTQQIRIFLQCLFALAVVALGTTDVMAQRGGGGRGGGGGGGGVGGRSAGHASPGAAKHENAGPAMSRPGVGATANGNAGGAPNIGKQGGGKPNVSKPAIANQGGGTPQPNIGSGGAKPNGGFERPKAGNQTTPKFGGDGPRGNGKTNLPGVGGDRPSVPGKTDRPNLAARPGGGASSSQLNDFLGGGNQGGDRLDLGQDNLPKLGKDDPKLSKDNLPKRGKDDPKFSKDNLPKRGKDDPKFSKDNLPKRGQDDPKFSKDNLPDVGVRGNDSTNVNVGDVNIGNSVNYSKNQQAWVDNHHTTGNEVRVNAGDRYAGAYNSGDYRRGAVGGYAYHDGWNNQGAYFGWHSVTYASFGTFMGAAWASAQPRYYAYGTGGNVYYENNVVYVDGQAAGTPEEYAAQSTALVAAAPAEVTDSDWLPLGIFALTREGVNDSQAMLELAVNKQGVLAGTYYNEATQVSRSLKGMLDQASQRAAIGFADGKNADVVLETGIQNLTQDEAPALLHQGKDLSGPVLLVRLEAPAADAGQ